MVLGCFPLERFCLELLNNLAHMFGETDWNLFCWQICGSHIVTYFSSKVRRRSCWETSNGDVSNDDLLHTRLSLPLNAVFSSVSLFTSMLNEFLICAMHAACPADVILISVLLGEQYQLWIPSLRGFFSLFLLLFHPHLQEPVNWVLFVCILRQYRRTRVWAVWQQ